VYVSFFIEILLKLKASAPMCGRELGVLEEVAHRDAFILTG